MAQAGNVDSINGRIRNTRTKEELTARRARDVLRYDPWTGLFWWRGRTNAMHRADMSRPAGSDDGSGYIRIMVDGHRVRAHRLAWLISYGEWPQGEVDHINGVKDDNRLSNLRVVTKGQNQQNSGVSKNNIVGLKGVASDRRHPGKWRARIRVKGNLINIGAYNCPAAASFAYQLAADKLFGEYARHR